MKQITFALLTLAFAAPAMADYNLSAKSGKIVCSDNDGTELTINAKRTSISVHYSGDEGSPTVFPITGHDTDGDTRYSFISKGNLVVDLDDQGDQVTFKDSGETDALNCR